MPENFKLSVVSKDNGNESSENFYVLKKPGFSTFYVIPFKSWQQSLTSVRVLGNKGLLSSEQMAHI